MFTTFQIGLLCGIVSMFGYGLSNVAAKPLAEQLGSSAAVAWRQLFVSLFLAVAVYVVGLPSELPQRAVLLTIATSVLGYLPLLFFFQALKCGKVGVVSALTQAKILVTATLSVIFFGEMLGVVQIAGLLCVLAGLIVLSLSRDDSASPADVSGGMVAKSAAYALAAGVLWGVVFFLFKFCVNELGPWLASWLIESTVFVCACGHAFFERKDRPLSVPVPREILLVLVGAVTATLGTLFFNVGITRADVTVVSTFTFSAAVVSAVASRYFLGELLSRKQVVAVVGVVLGVIGVSTG